MEPQHANLKPAADFRWISLADGRFDFLGCGLMKSGFLEKLVARLDRVEPGEVQQVVSRLIRERGFFEGVFEALREGVLILEPNGVISYLNGAACRFFGLVPESAVGQRLGQQVRGLVWDEIAKPGRTLSRDLEVFYPENRYLNFYLSSIDPEGDESTPLGYVMLVRDLTRSRAEAEATLESERLNALTLLAAGVAHEIGNPLNSLDIHLQLIERRLRRLPRGDRAPVEEHLQTARQEIQRLDGILRQFLAAVRPTTPQRENSDLHALFRESERLLAPELEQRNIRVRTEFAEDLPIVPVDPAQFQQVFYNVLRNAYQAISAQGGEITVRTWFSEYEVRITIEDSGSGISPEVMGSLFEPYLTTKVSGTGLGLLIVRRIVREHGGDIEIQSEESHGTKVVIHLPLINRAVRLLANADAVIDLR